MKARRSKDLLGSKSAHEAPGREKSPRGFFAFQARAESPRPKHSLIPSHREARSLRFSALTFSEERARLPASRRVSYASSLAPSERRPITLSSFRRIREFIMFPVESRATRRPRKSEVFQPKGRGSFGGRRQAPRLEHRLCMQPFQAQTTSPSSWLQGGEIPRPFLLSRIVVTQR